MNNNGVKVSVDLHLFLSEWYKWANNGALQNSETPFIRRSGLCTNLRKWTLHENTKNQEIDTQKCLEMNNRLFHELTRLLPHGKIYPFGEESYMRDSKYHTHHLNESRLLWVEDIVYNSHIVTKGKIK